MNKFFTICIIFVTKRTCLENMYNVSVQGVILDYFMSILHSELFRSALSVITTLHVLEKESKKACTKYHMDISCTHDIVFTCV